MSQSTFSQIEERFSELPIADQQRLIDCLVRRIHGQTSEDRENETQLAQMAADPEIRRELDDIEREFALADADGLNHT